MCTNRMCAYIFCCIFSEEESFLECSRFQIYFAFIVFLFLESKPFPLRERGSNEAGKRNACFKKQGLSVQGTTDEALISACYTAERAGQSQGPQAAPHL